VVSHDLDTMLSSSQIRPPFIKGRNNGRELLVVDWIIDFDAENFLEWKAIGCSVLLSSS
jgi:hypothetical protein